MGADGVWGQLHDRASYRYFWQVLERAHQTGVVLGRRCCVFFVDGSLGRRKVTCFVLCYKFYSYLRPVHEGKASFLFLKGVSTMLQAYRDHVAERAALGIPPLPLSAKQNGRTD